MSTEFSPVMRLPIQIDTKRLIDIFNDVGVYKRILSSGTASLVHRPGAQDQWADGITSHVIRPNQEFYFSEGDFTEINSDLKQTYFEDCYRLLKLAAHDHLGRVRLFKRPPQTSSSLHQDLDIRLHVAIKTSECSFIVFPGRGIFHIPNDGYIYLIDTTKKHFVVNTHTSESRIHLVCSTYCGFVEERSRQNEILNFAQLLFKKIAQNKNVIKLNPTHADIAQVAL